MGSGSLSSILFKLHRAIEYNVHLRHPPRYVDGLEPSSRFVAAVLARGVDAGHLALDVQRRPALAPQQPTDGLVERTVPKLFCPDVVS